MSSPDDESYVWDLMGGCTLCSVAQNQRIALTTPFRIHFWPTSFWWNAVMKIRTYINKVCNCACLNLLFIPRIVRFVVESIEYILQILVLVVGIWLDMKNPSVVHILPKAWTEHAIDVSSFECRSAWNYHTGRFRWDWQTGFEIPFVCRVDWAWRTGSLCNIHPSCSAAVFPWVWFVASFEYGSWPSVYRFSRLWADALHRIWPNRRQDQEDFVGEPASGHLLSPNFHRPDW